MKFAIRDDDTSFFTAPAELEAAYDFVPSGTISLSVVPFTVPHHEKGVLPYGEGIPFGYYSIQDNAELVSFLMNHPRYDLMLHGYSHEYQFIGGQWYPEMLWKDENRILEEMQAGKKLLEETFHRNISVFVAPNNEVNAKTIRAVEALHMNYSGIISHHDRDWSLAYARNYVRRWGYRLRTGMRIPDVLEYGKHQEMVSFPLDQYDRLMQEYHQCKRRNTPFSVYTHYWQLNRDENAKALLKRIYNELTQDGAELVSLSSCFHLKTERR